MSQSLSSPGLFNKDLHILFVDDDQEILISFSELIRKLGHTCVTASNGMDALEKLRKNQFDIVITDMKMPHMDGLELIKKVKSVFGCEVDVIAITGHRSEYKYTDIIEAGASDFMTKPFSFDELEAKIMRIARKRFLLAELKHLSIRDGLTGLYNRRYLDKNLKREVARALRQRYDLYLLLIDIDNFKYFNDKYGHQHGDELIKELAKIVSSSIRMEVDSGYRYGGDEFAVLLTHVGRDQAFEIAERIRTKFNERNLKSPGLSIGLARLKGSSDLLEENVWMLFKEADIGLYLAKRNGGDQVGEERGEVSNGYMQSYYDPRFA